MAVDFPDSPSNGDTTTINGVVYTYNSTKTAWETLESVDANAALSDNPPTNPNNGDLWFNSASGELLVRYNDGTSSQWVGVSGPAGASASLSAVAEDILPDADSSRSLGSPTKKWKDLYLSGSTIHLGDSATLSAAPGGEIVLPSLKIGTGSNAVKLEANSSGGLETRAVVGGTTQAAKPAGGTTQVATLAAMQAIVNPSIGDLCSVTANNTIYMYNGTGFYKIAVMVNESPSAITGVDGAYALATDGTATTITANSSDPEGRILNWSYAVSSGSLTNGGGTTATIAQGTGVNTNVFTITPTTNSAYAGSFSITFNVTDNVNGAVNAVSAFTLSFSVANSRYTEVAVRATNTGSNQTFDDASTSNHTITANGDVIASTFSPHRAGGYSFKGDGNGDYLQIPHSTDTDLAGDFTIECWVWINAHKNSNGLVAKWARNYYGYVLYASNSGVEFNSGNSGSNGVWMDFAIGSPLALHQWHHLVVSRTGSTISTYLNGTRTNTSTDSSNCSASTPLIIGSYGDNSYSYDAYSLNGYLSNVRIVNGTGLYTGTTYTVPTAPLTPITNTKFLLGQLPYFKDQSTSNHAITPNGNVSLEPKSAFDNAPYSEASHGASAHFDGSGDYLDVGSSGIANFGTGNFTIEFWINSTDANALGSSASNIINPISSTGSGYWGLMFQNGKLRWNNSYNVANLWEVNAATILKGSFNHVAVVRNSGAFSIYFNGVSQSAASGTFTDTTNYSGDAGVRIGSGNANNFDGTLSDLRIVSSAVYTSNFTPPTTPLTAVTNTKFLLNPETSISDLSQKSEITCFGDAATSTTQVKFAGTKSIYGDGSGDYVSMPIDPIGTDDFTVEAWIYPTNLGSYATPISGATIGGAKGTVFGVDSWFVGNNISFQNFTSAANKIVVDQWQHIAITRQGTSLKLFYNGTQFDSGTNSTDLNQTTYVLFARYTDGSYLDYAGYIQDFRITKGLARYTANFTPPTAESQG